MTGTEGESGTGQPFYYVGDDVMPTDEQLDIARDLGYPAESLERMAEDGMPAFDASRVAMAQTAVGMMRDKYGVELRARDAWPLSEEGSVAYMVSAETVAGQESDCVPGQYLLRLEPDGEGGIALFEDYYAALVADEYGEWVEERMAEAAAQQAAALGVEVSVGAEPGHVMLGDEAGLNVPVQDTAGSLEGTLYVFFGPGELTEEACAEAAEELAAEAAGLGLGVTFCERAQITGFAWPGDEFGWRLGESYVHSTLSGPQQDCYRWYGYGGIG